jgi:GT2 family glycosyltransferase
MMTGIFVVIPNFNGMELLKLNLPSVYVALKSSGITDFEIIVADDASTDSSIDFLMSHYPEIIIVRNEFNKGFSCNVNSGIRIALKDLVFILNSDVELTDSYFSPLIEYFDMDDTFGVMGRIVGMDGGTIHDGAKYPQYMFTRIFSNKNYICRDRNSLFTLFLSGANALVDRRKLELLNGFDEIYSPYYSEDVDLGLRAWNCGYKLYYEHQAVCKHNMSATTKKIPHHQKRKISKRNIFILHYVHLRGIELFCYVMILFIKTFIKCLIFDVKYMRLLFLFYQSIPQLSKIRKKNKEKSISLGKRRSLKKRYVLLNRI